MAQPIPPADPVRDEATLASDRARLDELVARAIPAALPALRARMEQDTAETAAEGWIDDATRTLGTMLALPGVLDTADARARLAETLRAEVPPPSDAEVRAEGEAFAGVAVRSWLHVLEDAVANAPRAVLNAELLPEGHTGWHTITESVAPFGVEEPVLVAWWRAFVAAMRGDTGTLVEGLALTFEAGEIAVVRVGHEDAPLAASGVRARDDEGGGRRSGDGST